ncbi:hypothetical protein [Oceaniradius stylonematis]|uniref:hypothetical protein n=1 Tax=Oceaniradius stylonematis TaxID=2184161 RepID=UPI00273E8644|nr:hypothetical protein [Oceaniradius stylonematis]
MILPRNFARSYFIAFLLFLTLQYGYYRLMPANHWAEYHAVVYDGVKPNSGRLQFRSDRTLHRTVNIGGNDHLWCDADKDGEFGHFSSWPWRSDQAPPRDRHLTAPWAYLGELPWPGVSCYMRSVVSVELPYGITKPLPPVISLPFIIPET